METRDDYELVAQRLSELNEKIAALESRLSAEEKVSARLEAAALTTARALQEVSHHWDAVYEAMRRVETADDEIAAEARGEQYRSSSSRRD